MTEKTIIYLFVLFIYFIDKIVDGVPVASFGDPFKHPVCDFEQNFCTGFEKGKYNFEWQLNTGTTASPDTGPVGDNTRGMNGTGNYLYIESSNKLNGKKARYQTITLETKPATIVCLQFAFHMFGHTMGDLKVIHQEVPSGRETVVFHLSGNQESKGWSEAFVPIITSDSAFKIVFEGSTSFSFYGDMAIDDIKFSDNPSCTFYPFHARPKKSLHPTGRPSIKGPENKTTCGLSKRITKSNIARLIGGHDAELGAWPWMAMLQIRNKASRSYDLLCGGTLLGVNWVVTAAHCLTNHRYKNELQVRLGAFKRAYKSEFSQDMKVEDVYIHEKYRTGEEFNYDIALVKLSKPAKINEYVNSVCLHHENWDIEEGEMCTILGWGKLWNDGVDGAPLADVLQQGKVPIRSHRNCTKAYGGQVTKTMICAGKDEGSPDTCLLDSGGPLLCRNNDQWKLVGVTSWGINAGCGLPKKYGVYTKIKSVRNWIRDVVENHKRFYRPLHFNVE